MADKPDAATRAAEKIWGNLCAHRAFLLDNLVSIQEELAGIIRAEFNQETKPRDIAPKLGNGRRSPRNADP